MSIQRELKRAKIQENNGVHTIFTLAETSIIPLSEEEFMFYAQLGMSAAEFKLPLSTPPGYELRLDNKDSLEAAYYAGNPYYRMEAALREHLSEAEQQEKMPAIMTRFIALLDLVSEGKLKPWVNHDPHEPDYILIKEAVFRAAAKAPVNSSLQFDSKEFRRIVEEILLLEADA
jgi:hypothetical protein